MNPFQNSFSSGDIYKDQNLNILKWIIGIFLGTFIYANLSLQVPALREFNRNFLYLNIDKPYMLWQSLTYIFIHKEVFHLLFNLIIFYQFGRMILTVMSSKEFLNYFLFCGFGGAFFGYLMNIFFSEPPVPVIGASGAIFGILYAAYHYFKEETISFWGVFPLKIKTLILILVVIEIATLFRPDGVAHFAHLGGMAFGLFYFRYGNDFIHYYQTRKLEKENANIEKEIKKDAEIKTEVDAILKKISEEGMGALTEEEKKFLNKASSRFKNN